MLDYTVLYKAELDIGDDWSAIGQWDVFLSGYTAAERVRYVYDRVPAKSKHWLVFPEYQFPADVCGGETSYASAEYNEAEYIAGFWAENSQDLSTKRVCVDMTGFVRPYLMFLLHWFLQNKLQQFDAIYSEPIIYSKREETEFSDEAVIEVRQVAGFEGNHDPDISNDLLIIGSGYDHQLISRVAENKDHAKKVQVFGFPSLRADMYQENVLRAQKAEEAVGRQTSDEISSVFAPANDPFVVASVLRETVDRHRRRSPLTNLYLSPLATKAQVLGFALYYLTECRGQPASILFPFCKNYAQETSRGIARAWRYTVELSAK